MPRFKEQSPDNLEIFPPAIAINVRFYKITPDGVMGNTRRRLEPESSVGEAHDILEAAEQVGSIHQGDEPRITFKPCRGGTEILTDEKNAKKIAEELQLKGYIDDDTYYAWFNTLGLDGVFSENIPVNTLRRARDSASEAAKKSVDKEIGKAPKGRNLLRRLFG